MTLTIIIPAFNAEDTLQNSIESALSCFKNQEILIIDDGSKDTTGEICDLYAMKYKNIRVVHTKNEGVSKARNIGIAEAAGEYIIFLDADDCIITDGLLNIEEQMKECDMLLCSFYERNIKGNIISKFIFEDKYIEPSNIADTFLHNKYSFYGPWAKVYKRDIIIRNNLRFNIGQKYGEDIVFVLSYLSHISKGIKLSSNVFYLHLINPKGASFYLRYYDNMNLYLFNQLQAFEKLLQSEKIVTSNILTDFACTLFEEALLHYYQRLNKADFYNKYRESYRIFKHYIQTSILRKHHLFTFIKDDNDIIDIPTTIQKFYERNFIKKAKYKLKRIIYRNI